MTKTETVAKRLDALTVQAVTRPRMARGHQPSLFEEMPRKTGDYHWLNKVMNAVMGTATMDAAVRAAAAKVAKKKQAATREDGKSFETAVQDAIANQDAADRILAEADIEQLAELAIAKGPEDFIVTITHADGRSWVCHTNIKWTAADGSCDLCSRKRLLGVLYGSQAKRDPNAIYRAACGAYTLRGDYWVWVVSKSDLDDRYAFPVVHAAGAPIISLNATRPDTVSVVLDRHEVTETPNMPAFQEQLLDTKVRGARDFIIRVRLSQGDTLEEAVRKTYQLDVDALLTKVALLLDDADDEQVGA